LSSGERDPPLRHPSNRHVDRAEQRCALRWSTYPHHSHHQSNRRVRVVPEDAMLIAIDGTAAGVANDALRVFNPSLLLLTRRSNHKELIEYKVRV
jgi:hypothetical protein